MLCNVSVTLSELILDVHQRSDSTELAEAVSIELHYEGSIILNLPQTHYDISVNDTLADRLVPWI